MSNSSINTASDSGNQGSAAAKNPPGPTILATTILAGEIIQKSDLIVVRSDGLGYYALPPGSPGSLFRPISLAQPEVVINQLQETASLASNAVNTSGVVGQASVLLANGNAAIAYTANGSVQVSIVDQNGKILNNQQLAPATGSNYSIAMILLENSNVAIFFYTGTTPVLNVSILDQTGAWVVSNTVIDSSTGGGAISAATLVGGNIAIGYTDGPNCNPKLQVISELGVNVTPAFVADTSVAPVSSSQSISVSALVGGGFAIAYTKTDGSIGSVYSGIYNGNGQLLSNLFQVGQTLTVCPNGAFVNTAALTGGGFAVTSYGGTGPGFALNLYNATGTIQGTNILLGAYDGVDAPSRVGLIGLSTGNVGVVWRGGNSASGVVYTPVGIPASPIVGYGATSGAISLTANATSGATLALQGSGVLNVGTLDNTLSGSAGVTSLLVGNQNSIPFVQPVASSLDPSVTAVLAGTVGNNNIVFGVFASYTVDQATLIGVAIKAAGAQQNLAVQTTGVAPLRLSFNQPYSIDANSNSIPGQKMSVIGNTALLKGIQQ